MSSMGNNHAMDLAELFANAAKPDPTRPFITFYDDATGERTELSYVTMDNWIQKTANFLYDQLDLDATDTATVALPAHWLSAAVLLGCWRLGLAIRHEPGTVDVAFSAESDSVETVEADHHCVVAMTPLATRLTAAAPSAAASAGDVVDFLAEVRVHGDHFSPISPLDPEAPALLALPGGGNRSQTQLVEAATARAAELGIADNERILLSGESLRPLDWLLVPLAIKGSVVLCRNPASQDLSTRASNEKARILTL